MFEIGARRKGESVLLALTSTDEQLYVILKYCHNHTPVYSEIVGNSEAVNQVYAHSLKIPTERIRSCHRSS